MARSSGTEAGPMLHGQGTLDLPCRCRTGSEGPRLSCVNSTAERVPFPFHKAASTNGGSRRVVSFLQHGISAAYLEAEREVQGSPTTLNGIGGLGHFFFAEGSCLGSGKGINPVGG